MIRDPRRRACSRGEAVYASVPRHHPGPAPASPAFDPQIRSVHRGHGVRLFSTPCSGFDCCERGPGRAWRQPRAFRARVQEAGGPSQSVGRACGVRKRIHDCLSCRGCLVLGDPRGHDGAGFRNRPSRGLLGLARQPIDGPVGDRVFSLQLPTGEDARHWIVRQGALGLAGARGGLVGCEADGRPDPCRARSSQVKVAEHILTGHKVAIKILNRRKIKQMDMEEKGAWDD